MLFRSVSQSRYDFAGDYWTLLQKPVDAFLGEDFAEIDLGDGVIALVGALKPEENDEEENGEKPEEGQMEEKTKGMGEEEKKPTALPVTARMTPREEPQLSFFGEDIS